MTAPHYVSGSCEGETCRFRLMPDLAVCERPATHKVGEEIPWDDPMPNRHNLTAYICCRHFRQVVGGSCGA